MGHCAYCVFWKHDYYDQGKCKQIQEKIDITIDSGWSGGTVDFISTDADFGCVLFEENKSARENPIVTTQ